MIPDRHNFLFSTVLILVLVNSQAAFSQQNRGAAPKQKESGEGRYGESYYLPNCPISNEKLGSMGEPVVKLYDGREVRFCCNECPPKFEKDKQKGFTKIDEQIIKDQLPLYPLRTSLVSSKNLPDKPFDFVYANRLVRLVDKKEKDRFLKEPERFLNELNKAAIAQQGKGYTLKTCVVSGDKLGGKMGKPVDVVLAGRLIRLCCNECKKDLEKTPAAYIAKVDTASGSSKKEDGVQEQHHKPHGQ